VQPIQYWRRKRPTLGLDGTRVGASFCNAQVRTRSHLTHKRELTTHSLEPAGLSMVGDGVGISPGQVKR
jgi:hypothetical protein